MDTANAKAPQNFKDLLVWQRGMALAKWIYEITRTFPSDERFGLVAQMRRAAMSIPSNIAEGQARHTTGEFVQFRRLVSRIGDSTAAERRAGILLGEGNPE
jgi:beta-glucosidase-like glycosyl hydrolase